MTQLCYDKEYIFSSQIVAWGCLFREIEFKKYTSFSWNRVEQCRDFNGGLRIVWASLNFPEANPMLILPWGWLEISGQVKLQASKVKMVDAETGVTEPGWWLGLLWYDVYEMFQVFKHKTHEPKIGWLCFCRFWVFGHNFGVFEDLRVSSVKKSCYALP